MMHQSQHSLSAAAMLWHLPAGHALRLPAAAHTRWLRLAGGRLWLTRDAARRAPADGPPADEWLGVGQAVALAPGVSVVAEGWPSADFELLEAPPPG